ncbi:sensor histidine kinase [Oceanobacillus zhaokaii]|uniref:histidine kinase n=1 Tax=Oceanobacillus zhaokaii TaxID=2052660 RepID=A0A345PLW3_9BACI|nr:sensor histidine kinase [Oceanobacillus zhaokaii]AXI10993.1 sensor histidine kinase [Oceanobacillus zhaokaii]
MINKLYPRDQIRNYLLIDVISIVFFCYIVLRSGTIFGFWGNLFLLLVFLVSFYIGLWYKDWRLLAAVLLGLSIITLFGVLVSPSILLFGFIFADLIGRSKSKVHIMIGIMAIAAMFLIVYWKGTGNLFKQDYWILLPILILQLTFPILIYIKEKAKGLQGELDAANIQIEKYIQQEERQRIARDLHDTLGQTLTMIKLKSELTSRLINNDSTRAKQELEDILMMTRRALNQVREAVSEMKFISLESEIENSQKLMEAIGIELEIAKKELPLLPSVAQTMIALSIREAMTNIIKHSKASQCTLKFEIIDNMFNIQIIDNGIGLKRKEIGNGIQSMKERMSAVQGTAMIKGLSSGGTNVTLSLPIFQMERGNLAL